MKHIRFTVVAAIAAPLLLSSVRPATDVAFSPSDGSRVTKTFTLEMESTIDDMEVTVNGESPPSPGIEAVTTDLSSVTVTDTYESVGPGRPEKLLRTYDSISSSTSAEMELPTGSQDIESEGESDLEGKTVRFTWNAETESFDAAFADDEEGDEELLSDLTEDMDLRALLPSGGVDEGAVWDIEPGAVVYLLAPGGNLKVESDNEMDAELGGSADFAKMLDEIDGTGSGTFESTREVDGRRMAVVKLSFVVDSTKDITEMAVRAAEKATNDMGAEQTIHSSDVTFDFELEGTLLWDLEAGRVHSVEVTGTSSSVIDSAATMVMMGQEMEVEQAIYISGTVEVRLEVTAE